MRPSAECIRLIKEFEGCRFSAYRDIAGVWTIGYGHTHGVEAGMSVDQARADSMLADDLERAADQVKACLARPVSQWQFDALVCFEFNTGGLKGSTLQRLLNSGDYAGAAEQFPRWNKATVDGMVVEVPGLTRRRAAERALFLREAA